MGVIGKHTVDEIFQTARVEEVVGDFVSLKKRGVNMIGHCPFHDEKTPSFTVSPTKGIYKCFGCGAGGNAVNFLMEHEHYTYPEALRFLANRYGIEIEEEELTPEMEQEQSEKESLFVVMNFANDFFKTQLHETDEGKAIGLSYFKERGFTEEIIGKFELGYSPENWDTLTKKALEEGYKLTYLEKAGLTKIKDERQYDSYRDRVIFPIQNLSGRVIGFGGRTLKSDKKIPKYINSPENEIYDKSRSLYGIYQAKKAIVANDNCYLVEGYTDVISLHQAGVENVVASSGTSLTIEQIKLIKRYTPNITMLYDGDSAGIKASFRGIDLILEQGMNVRVVQFPEGEDPDSYARKVSQEEFKNYISEEASDFIVFKTTVLAVDTQNDPIEKAKLVHEIVNSIALVPDHIARDLYVQQCSRLLEISEEALHSELTKARKNTAYKRKREQEREAGHTQEVITDTSAKAQQYKEVNTPYYQERDVIRLLLNYGSESINLATEDNELLEISVAGFIVQEIVYDGLSFQDEVLANILKEIVAFESNGIPFDVSHFTTHENEEIRLTAIELMSKKYELHNWEKGEIFVETEEQKLKQAVVGAVRSFKTKKVLLLIRENQNELKKATEKGIDTTELLKRQLLLDGVKSKLATAQSRIVIN